MFKKTSFLTRLAGIGLLMATTILQIYIVANGNLNLSLSLVLIISIAVILVSKNLLSRKHWRFLTLLVLVNLLMSVLYLWSVTELTLIKVVVNSSEDKFTAQTNDERPMPTTSIDSKIAQVKTVKGPIGIYVGPQNTSRFFEYLYKPGILGDLAKFLDISRLPPAIKKITVRDRQSGNLIYESNFSNGDISSWRFASGAWKIDEMGNLSSTSTGWAYIGAEEWQDYIAEIEVIRANEYFGFSFLALNDDPSQGAFLAIIPIQEVYQWGKWDGSFRPLVNYMWFRKPIIAHLQEVLSLFIKNWQICIAIALIASATSLVLSIPLSILSYRKNQFSRKNSPALKKALAITSVVIIALISIAATRFALYIATDLLEKLPHVQDSVAYYFQAQTLALGRLYAPTPPFWEAFQFQYIVTSNNKWFTVYPPGWPILLAIGIIAKVPWAVNPILLGLGIFLMSLSGYFAFGKKVAVMTALLAISSSFLVILAGEYMSHTSAFFCYSAFLACAFYLFTHETKSGATELIVSGLMGLAGGWLFVIRQFTAVMLILPFAIYFAKDLLLRKNGKRWLIALVAALIASSVYFIDNWAITGNALKNTYSFTPDSLFGFMPAIGMRNGHTVSDGLVNIKTLFLELLRGLYGWPLFATLAFFFAPFALGKAQKTSWLLLASAACLVFGYMAYWAPGVMYGPRYYYEAIPCFMLLSAQGIWVIASRASSLAETLLNIKTPKITASLPVLLIVCVLFYSNFVSYWPIKIQLKGYNFVNGEMLGAVNRSGLQNAIIFVEGSGYPGGWPVYGNVFSQNDPLLSNNTIFAHDQGEQKNRFVASGYPGRSPYLLTTSRQIKPLSFQSLTENEQESLKPAPTPQPPSSTPNNNSSKVVTKEKPQTSNNSINIEFARIADIPESLQSPGGLTIDSNGNALIVDTGNKRIAVFNKEGIFVKFLQPSQNSFEWPIDIATLPSGGIVVLDLQQDGSGRVVKLSAQFDSPQIFSIPGGSYFPRGIATSTNGDLLIANTGYAAVVLMDKNGALIKQFGEKVGNKPGEFSDPSALISTRSGLIYVIDAGNSRVQILKPTGEIAGIFEIPRLNSSKSSRLFELPDNTLLMTVPEKGAIQHYSPEGKLLGEMSAWGNETGQLQAPTGLQVTGNELWISDSNKNQIQIWNFK